jgi:hypothetical protein
MARVWAWDNMDGFYVRITERDDNSLDVLVAYENQRAWHTVREVIEDAIETAHRIIKEQTIVLAIIDPELPCP